MARIYRPLEENQGQTTADSTRPDIGVTTPTLDPTSVKEELRRLQTQITDLALSHSSDFRILHQQLQRKDLEIDELRQQLKNEKAKRKCSKGETLILKNRLKEQDEKVKEMNTEVTNLTAKVYEKTCENENLRGRVNECVVS